MAFNETDFDESTFNKVSAIEQLIDAIDERREALQTAPEDSENEATYSISELKYLEKYKIQSGINQNLEPTFYENSNQTEKEEYSLDDDEFISINGKYKDTPSSTDVTRRVLDREFLNAIASKVANLIPNYINDSGSTTTIGEGDTIGELENALQEEQEGSYKLKWQDDIYKYHWEPDEALLEGDSIIEPSFTYLDYSAYSLEANNEWVKTPKYRTEFLKHNQSSVCRNAQIGKSFTIEEEKEQTLESQTFTVYGYQENDNSFEEEERDEAPNSSKEITKTRYYRPIILEADEYDKYELAKFVFYLKAMEIEFSNFGLEGINGTWRFERETDTDYHPSNFVPNDGFSRWSLEHGEYQVTFADYGNQDRFVIADEDTAYYYCNDFSFYSPDKNIWLPVQKDNPVSNRFEAPKNNNHIGGGKPLTKAVGNREINLASIGNAPLPNIYQPNISEQKINWEIANEAEAIDLDLEITGRTITKEKLSGVYVYDEEQSIEGEETVLDKVYNQINSIVIDDIYEPVETPLDESILDNCLIVNFEAVDLIGDVSNIFWASNLSPKRFDDLKEIIKQLKATEIATVDLDDEQQEAFKVFEYGDNLSDGVWVETLTSWTHSGTCSPLPDDETNSDSNTGIDSYTVNTLDNFTKETFTTNETWTQLLNRINNTYIDIQSADNRWIDNRTIDFKDTYDCGEPEECTVLTERVDNSEYHSTTAYVQAYGWEGLIKPSYLNSSLGGTVNYFYREINEASYDYDENVLEHNEDKETLDSTTSNCFQSSATKGDKVYTIGNPYNYLEHLQSPLKSFATSASLDESQSFSNFSKIAEVANNQLVIENYDNTWKEVYTNDYGDECNDNCVTTIEDNYIELEQEGYASFSTEFKGICTWNFEYV